MTKFQGHSVHPSMLSLHTLEKFLHHLLLLLSTFSSASWPNTSLQYSYVITASGCTCLWVSCFSLCLPIFPSLGNSSQDLWKRKWTLDCSMIHGTLILLCCINHYEEWCGPVWGKREISSINCSAVTAHPALEEKQAALPHTDKLKPWSWLLSKNNKRTSSFKRSQSETYHFYF